METPWKGVVTEQVTGVDEGIRTLYKQVNGLLLYQMSYISNVEDVGNRTRVSRLSPVLDH